MSENSINFLFVEKDFWHIKYFYFYNIIQINGKKNQANVKFCF